VLSELLAKLAQALDRRAIPYMVIGGQAVLIHGEPRMTADVDVTVGVDIDRLGDICAMADELGLRTAVPDVKEFASRTMVLPFNDDASGAGIDVVFSRFPYERQAIGRTVSVRIGPVDVRFASAEDLVVHKVFAGRPRDLDDVLSVLAKNPKIDLAYVRHWLGELGRMVDVDVLPQLETLISSVKRP
jgi:hypothetical protein